MKPSEEIRRIVERWMQAISERDSESSLERVSDLPGALMIGTDPEEWFHGAEARAIWARQLEELDSFSVVGTEIEAWEEGTVGWASVKEKISWDDQEAEARATYVFHLERGEWKAVQIHWSMPRGNVDLFGRELTVSLDALERAIERERPDLFATLAVDGTVTIVFTDIVDSTVLTSRLGDHAWRDVLRRHDTVIRDVTGHHGGTVVETQGDGSMLAFSSARRAVACAQVIQRDMSTAFPDDSPPIRIRIGVHTGDAIQEADRFFGTTVHYAARVASQALGGEVLVSNLVRELVASSGVSSPRVAKWSSRVSMARTGSSPSTSQIVSRRTSLFKRHSRTLAQASETSRDSDALSGGSVTAGVACLLRTSRQPTYELPSLTDARVRGRRRRAVVDVSPRRRT